MQWQSPHPPLAPIFMLHSLLCYSLKALQLQNFQQLNQLPETVFFWELIICQVSVYVTVLYSILRRSHDCNPPCFLRLVRNQGELRKHSDFIQKFSWSGKSRLEFLITMQKGVMEKTRCKAEYCSCVVKYFYFNFCPKQLRK